MSRLTAGRVVVWVEGTAIKWGKREDCVRPDNHCTLFVPQGKRNDKDER